MKSWNEVVFHEVPLEKLFGLAPPTLSQASSTLVPVGVLSGTRSFYTHPFVPTYLVPTDRRRYSFGSVAEGWVSPLSEARPSVLPRSICTVLVCTLLCSSPHAAPVPVPISTLVSSKPTQIWVLQLPFPTFYRIYED